MKRVSSIQCMDDHEIEVLLDDTEFHTAESIIEAEIKAASTDTCIVEEDIYERVEEEQEVIIAEQVTEMAATEEQSSVKVQEILENMLESLSETAKESEAAESHGEEGKYTSILEDSIPANNLTDEPQILKEPETVSVKNISQGTSIEMPSDASIRVEVQSPTGQEAEDVPTQSEATKTELSDVHVLEEAEITALTVVYVDSIPEDDQIVESIPLEAMESLENTGEHHKEEQGHKIQKLDAATQDMEVQMEEHSKETIREVSLGEGRGAMGVDNHLKSQAKSVKDDQNQVDSERCSQRERNVVIKLRHDDNPLRHQNTQDIEVFLSYEKEYVIIKQEDMKDVSLNVHAPNVPSQLEDAEYFLSQTRVTEETSHQVEMNDEYTQQDSPHELQTLEDSEQTTATTTFEAVSEIAKSQNASSQEGSSEEVMCKSVEYGNILEAVIKNGGAFHAEATKHASAIEDITDHLREDAVAMTVEATVDAIEEPNSSELPAAS
ncbi:uncharacterized protein LOC133107875 [Conger conger]|nr:uncharacterized protein LOC133107875 [Conger conger]